MPEYYYPPQKLHGELDSVYDTMRALGGDLYIPATHDGAGAVNQFVRADGTAPLVGTPVGTPTFDQGGKIPEILGLSPQATFDASTEGVEFTTTIGDPVNMSNGGTLLFLLTPGDLSVDGIGSVIQKSTVASDVVTNGYWLFIRSAGNIVFRTSDGTGTPTEVTTGSGVVSDGDISFVAVTLDLLGNAKIYLNGVLIMSGSGMQIPSNVASDVRVGTRLGDAYPVNGPVDFGSLHDDTVLTLSQVQTIAGQCGPLGPTVDPDEGVLTMVSEKTSDLTVSVRHDGVDGATGVNYTVDGGAAVYTAGASGANIVLTIPHNSGTPETVKIWPATSAASGRVGGLTRIVAIDDGLTSLDVGDLASLTELFCGDNAIPTLDVSGLTLLTKVECYRSSIASIDVSGATSLDTLWCYDNALTSLDVGGLTSLTNLRCNGNAIPSLLATGAELSSTSSRIYSNSLSEAALIAFVDSLAATTTGIISYGDNPGSAAFETWLLTGDDKGYIWANST